MAIYGLDRAGFEQKLRAHLSPTTPIRSAEFLHGREKKLEDIRRSLVADGRNIFIYGDRGVGKTSLAQTAALEHQSSENAPILLTCDPGSSFYQIAKDLGSALISQDPSKGKVTNSSRWSLSLSGLSAELQRSVEQGKIPEMNSINEAVQVVDFAARRHSKAPVVVLDEFERIRDPDQRVLFADFIKQVGDQSVPIKMIFCGIGASLDHLLDAHHSCYRYLTPVELQRLGFDGRLDIIDGARSAFGLDMDDTTRYRIAKISDGFPHFVHLVCEKLFWQVFEAEAVLGCVRAIDFAAAINVAVEDVEAHLRSDYERATKKYNDDYEEVLWAVADDQMLSRRSADVYQSYLRLMQVRNRTALSRDRFNQRMNALKQPAAGNILRASRAGWYEFRENIVRGYVRLRAQSQGVELEQDHPLLGRRYHGIDKTRIE